MSLYIFASMRNATSRGLLILLLLLSAQAWALDATFIRTKLALSSTVAGNANTSYTFNGTVKNLTGADITTAGHFVVTFGVGTDLTGISGTFKTTGTPVGIVITTGTDGQGRPTATFLCPTALGTKKRFTLKLDGIKNPNLAASYSAFISAENSTFNGTTGHDTAVYAYTIIPGAASKLGFVQQPTDPSYQGRTIVPPVRVAVQDAAGNTITSATSTITLTITPGTGAGGAFLSGNLSKAAVNGVADFNNLNINLNSPVGTPYRLRATTNGGISLADSSTFAIIDAPSNYLQFTTNPPATPQAGDNLMMQVSVKDGVNNTVVTNQVFTITLNASPSISLFPAGTSSVTADTVNGVATFNVNIHTAGTYIFVASAGGVAGANSSSVTVGAAAASALTFVRQPADTTAGLDDGTATPPVSPIFSANGDPVEVAVTDAYGNIVPGRTDLVTISIDAGSGTPGAQFTGNLAGNAGSAGSQDTPPLTTIDSVAIFDNLNINLVGTNYVLRAQAAFLTDGVSTSFKINPEAASVLVVSGMNNPSVLGIATNLTVTAKDEFGNTDTNYRGQVTFDSNDVTTTVPGDYTFIAGDNGVHAFTNGVIFNTVGAAQSVTATDVQLLFFGTQTVLVSQGISSTTVLSATPNPSGSTETVTFTAKVTGAGVTPTGTVSFYDGATLLGSGALDGNGVATYSTNTLSMGNHTTINAQYGGDTNYLNSSSGNFTQSVVANTSTTALGVDVNPSRYGQAVQFTATITPSAGTPTGTVTFYDGAASIGSGNVAGGVATFTTTTLAAGVHNISATYNGDGTVGMSSSNTVPQTVNATDTTTAVITSGSPSVFGQGVIFTATVSSNPPGAGTPTGNVVFTIDGQAQGPSTMIGGVATFNTATLPVGAHTIDAAYIGNANYNTSSSGLSGGQTVNKADTTLVITPGSNPSEFGQALTLSAHVASVAPGNGTPAGTVTFTIDGVAQTPVALSGGNAALSGLNLSLGTHTVSAAYSGDAAHNVSTGNLSGGQVVSDTTKPTVSSPFGADVPSADVNQVVTFTWGVNDLTSLTYVFDFGDGTTLTTSTPSVQHAFAIPSVFTVTATATDAGGNTINSTLSFTVASQGEAPSTDLCGPGSLELKVKQIQARIKFPGTLNKCMLTLKGTIALMDGFDPLGQVVQWEIGTIAGAATLNSKGGSPAGNVTAKVQFKKPGKGQPFTARPGTVTIAMKNQNLGTLVLAGITNINSTSANKKGDPATIDSCVVLKGKQSYHASSLGTYKSTKDKSAQFLAKFK